MISVNDFKCRFPEFSDDVEYPTVRIEIFIADSLLDLGTDEDRWCDKYDRAQAYYVAHLLTLGTKTEAGDVAASTGSIKSKSAGGVSVSRGLVDKDRSDGDDLLASTAYGMQFLSIRNSCFVGFLTADCL